MDETDLVPRMGILYKKFSTEAFTGLVVKYYTDGQIKTKSEYKNGLEVKIYEQYYENGQVKFAGTLKDGLRDGLWEFNYGNGQLLRQLGEQGQGCSLGLSFGQGVLRGGQWRLRPSLLLTFFRSNILR